jgi:hypothetical protein
VEIGHGNGKGGLRSINSPGDTGVIASNKKRETKSGVSRSRVNRVVRDGARPGSYGSSITLYHFPDGAVNAAALDENYRITAKEW